MRFPIPLILVLALYLQGCGSGGEVTLTSEEQGDDPVVLEIPIAYIKRPIPEEWSDIRAPLSFSGGAKLYVKARSSTTAEEIEVSNLLVEIIAQEEGVNEENIVLDIKDLESSYDGSTLIFAARGVPQPVAANLDQTTWNLWTYDIRNGIAQYLIPSRIKRNEGMASGGGHDIAPHFLPDDRVVFSSTRQVAAQARQLNEGRVQLFAALDESRRDPAAVLHIYDPQMRGEEFRQISFNLSHDLDPMVRANGDIVFSRWSNTATNHVSLYSVLPSGHGLSPLYGFHSANSGTEGSRIGYTQARELDDGRLASLVRPYAGAAAGINLAGDIYLLDTAAFSDAQQSVDAAAGVDGGQVALTETEIRTDGQLSPGGQFGSVYALRDGSGRLLVTWTDCRVIDAESADPNAPRYIPCTLQPESQDSAPPLFGGWLYDPAANVQRPVVLPEEGYYLSELVAAEARDFPAVQSLPDDHNADLASQSKGHLLIDSVYDIDGTDTSPAGIAAHAQAGSAAYLARPVRFLRFYQTVPIPDREVFEIPDAASGVSGGSDFREILGYVPVEPDGSVSVILPADRPLMFDLLDERGRRIGSPHNYWLQLAAGEVVRCTGCHESGSTRPHGRTDVMLTTANPGAMGLASGGMGFPGTDAATLFATEGGQSMAEVWNLHRPIDNPTEVERSPALHPQYTDEWARADVTGSPDIIDREYSAQWTDIPPERALIVPSFDPEQPDRIVINYPDHVQPIWERMRAPMLTPSGTTVENCVGCHGSQADALVPAGQLDLTAAASDIDANHLRSYRELLSSDQEQWLDAQDQLGDRQRLCVEVNDEGETIETVATVNVSAALRAGSANASSRFFDCFEGGSCGRPDSPTIPDNCTEEGTPIPATRNTVNHVGLLSEAELRLLSEWLDMGAQYYNNPFDERLRD